MNLMIIPGKIKQSLSQVTIVQEIVKFVTNKQLIQLKWLSDLKLVSHSRGWNYQTSQSSAIQRCEPSKTISEDILGNINTGKKIFKNHRENNLAKAEMLYSSLYAVTRYPVPETFICEMSDVFLLVPNGGILTNQLEIVTQSAARNTINPPLYIHSYPNKNDCLSGTYVSFLGLWGDIHYSHWLLDILPRVSLLKHLSSNLQDDLQFIVPNQLQTYHIEALTLLGIPQERWISMPNGVYRLEKFVLCHAAERSMVVNGKHFSEVRNSLVKAVIGSEINSKVTRRVYISRRNSRRKIINEEELMPVLDKYGFEVYCCEKMSLKEQIRLFSETEVVLGAHGAGIHNQIFCNPGAKIIEIYNPIWVYHGTFRIANLMNHEHWHTFGEDTGAENSIYMNPNKLDKVLSYALRQNDFIEKIY
ncbi:MAG: glycosyltransferase family 61 protein [Coleofasciculus sp. A1-SPW-01]|uniref:glycosyltransferase family 61 protein n=1 Tax=Coleofasciculus sp. A1-SPW-01 TaxID=3070819 RepID=UPI003302CFA2